MNTSAIKVATALFTAISCAGCAGLQTVVDAQPAQNLVQLTPEQEAKAMTEWNEQIAADMKRE